MRIGFIGAGQMACALAKGFVDRGRVTPAEVSASDCVASSRDNFSAVLPGASVGQDNRQVLAASNVIFLAVKPQHIVSVCQELAPCDGERLIVSIAAGVDIAQLSTHLQSKRVIRVMPNTPCLVGQGAAAFSRGAGASDDDARQVQHLLEAVGVCTELPEALLDAVTGLSGSGPAFVYLFIEALADGGVRMGLPRHVALQLAAQTVLGSAQMVLTAQEHPAVLKDRVASPAGTTIAGLHALESGAFRGIVISAVQQATERASQLGQSSAGKSRV